jgi:hypothetical protein
MKNDSMKVFFRNFPHDFNEKDNFFLQLVKDSNELIEVERDIYFYGCYPDKNIVKKAILFATSKMSNKGMTKWLKFQQGIGIPTDLHAFNVWCTFENRRPPVEGYDLTYTFDKDQLNGTNYYLPLLYLYLEINAAGSKHKYKVSQLMRQRNLSLEELAFKTGFVSSFINNPHPTRLHAVKQLQKVGEVKLFGRSVNNYVDNKLEEASKYWFNLCFENDLYPGYVTEKVLEAWLGWTIPLYWGNDAYEILNPAAIINLSKFPSMTDFINYVENLYKDKSAMIEMINQPLLAKNFQYEDLVNFMNRGLKKKFAHE